MSKINKTIPQGWSLKKLSEVLDYERPDEYIVKSTSYSDKAKTPVLTANKSFVLGYTDEDFGIYENVPVIIFDDFTTDSKYVNFPFKVKSSAIKILKEKGKGVDLRFVYEKMKSINFPTGSHKRFYISQYQNLEILTPPFPEQQKISEILGTVDEDIEKTEEIIKSTEKLKKGLMQQLFTRGIGHTKFKETKIGQIPEEWDLVEIKKIAEVKAGNGFPIKYQGDKNTTTPFYKVSDMNLYGNEKYMNIANNYANDELVKKIKGNIFPKGSIIYPKVGAALLGNKRRILAQESLVDNNVGVLIPNKKVISEYLYFWMLQIDMAQFSGNGALPAVNASIVEEILVKLPQFNEQEKIVRTLNCVDEKILTNKKLKEKLTLLKKGLMQDLLSGKVRTKI